MQSVIETAAYLRHAKEAGVTDDERLAIVDLVASDPTIGEIMVGTSGARKVRFARQGAGKSAGYRIITFFAAEDVPVFLLDIFGKGDKANLSKADRNNLADVLGRIAAVYRAGAMAAAALTKKNGE